ncbi:MAG: uroporphyrinogen decarboxylase [Gammaproteobacteria bacterium]
MSHTFAPTNDRLLRALTRQPTDCTPVWLMRQAGRYLPEYRELRAQAGSFMALASNPELACEVTVQPTRRFDLDAAILFSDILTVPDAMGTGLYFAEGEGPKFERPVRSAADVKALPIPDVADELGYVTDALSRVRKELDNRIPVIGFCGSPWTVATYMVEGGSSKNYSIIKKMMFQEPKILHELLHKLTVTTTAYLDAQVRAGAQALMVFDTWGSALSGPTYREFSLRYMAELVKNVNRNSDHYVPLVLFTKGGGGWLEDMADTGCDALGLDWTVSLADARARVGERVGLQGNLDPGALYGTPESVKRSAQAVLDDFGQGDGHVFNLGHGIHPTIDPANVEALVTAVHEGSAR